MFGAGIEITVPAYGPVPWYVIPVVVVVVVVPVVYHSVTVLVLLTEDTAHPTLSHTRYRAQEPPATPPHSPGEDGPQP